MWTALCLAALVASALGSPLGGKSVGLDAHSYSLEVRQGLRTLGPAALIYDEYAICSASILRGNDKALSVRIGSRFFFNLFGQSVPVTEVIVHPDADVAVLVLKKTVSYKSASSIPVVGGPAAPGARVQVSSWNFLSFLEVSDEWLVQPRYCGGAGPGILCATGVAGSGALIATDGQLVGLVGSKGNGSLSGVESGVDLTAPSVQKFIAIATNRVVPTNTTTPTPSTETPATEATPIPRSSTEVPAPTKRPTNKKCTISTKHGMPKKEPVLLREEAANGVLAFRDPDHNNTIQLAAGERVLLVCSGKGNYLVADKSLQEAVVECVEDTTFLFKGNQVEWNKLSCKALAASSARRNGKCGNSGEFARIEIGFEAANGFALQIENCFNSVTFDAVYSRMNMTPAIAGHESGAKRPQFDPAGFYEGFSPNSLYVHKGQKKAIGELLGDSSLADKYIKDSSTSSYYLARGHLSAKADYILAAQQSATFYYINAAPQWQTFNGKNWEELEYSVREWVISSGRSVQVVTGTWGVATLPNKDGEETELYLGVSKKYLRVPKYYWKVVYDPATNEGTAFVGMNNPYHVTTEEDVFCKDECARYSWITWAQKDQDQGYSFCCDVNEFKKTVTTLPNDIDVKALL